jgi:hypothetical protein
MENKNMVSSYAFIIKYLCTSVPSPARLCVIKKHCIAANTELEIRN